MAYANLTLNKTAHIFFLFCFNTKEPLSTSSAHFHPYNLLFNSPNCPLWFLIFLVLLTRFLFFPSLFLTPFLHYELAPRTRILIW